MKIVLGSTSPRRKSIIGSLFGEFTAVAPSVDETHRPPESPEEFALRIAGDKCRSVLESGAAAGGAALIITADTIVTIDGHVIGKPDGLEDAARILRLLAGRTHRVITAMALHASGHGPDRGRIGYEATEVTFRKLDDAGIRRYLDTIDYRDKAGAYAFQEHGSMIVEGFRGSATNIIGFPLRLFFSMAAEMDAAATLFGL
ncbi:MAG TPA: Maf family protein [Spirochaetota bacterium]|nr:septum formation protein Maf [Spirochaetota bacterium]HOD14337.1 Maf family protein [Spirochaetota bacterium]HPG50785.1 Maf family protein [Spirochaetota bacterium]HPN12560.1 Maf family protein [Spirochaetota bacterium]HQL83933.1 Maf family protein [Spirochaetota bacterium]